MSVITIAAPPRAYLLLRRCLLGNVKQGIDPSDHRRGRTRRASHFGCAREIVETTSIGDVRAPAPRVGHQQHLSVLVPIALILTVPPLSLALSLLLPLPLLLSFAPRLTAGSSATTSDSPSAVHRRHPRERRVCG